MAGVNFNTRFTTAHRLVYDACIGTGRMRAFEPGRVGLASGAYWSNSTQNGVMEEYRRICYTTMKDTRTEHSNARIYLVRVSFIGARFAKGWVQVSPAEHADSHSASVLYFLDV